MKSDEEYNMLLSKYKKEKLAGVLFYFFPKFEQDYEILIQNRVIAITEDNELIWIYSKTSLCEYFREKSKFDKTNWQVLEDIFHYEKLGEINKKAQGNSKDYKKIKEIIKQ